MAAPAGAGDGGAYEDDDADVGHGGDLMGEPDGLTGELVEVRGRRTSARGRCLGRRAEDARFLVHLLDGSYVQVDEEELQTWTPAPPLEGGFDHLWPSAGPKNEPSDLDMLPLLAEQVVDALCGRGWCLVQLFGSDKLHKAAAKQAQRLPDLATLRAELLPDLLGPESRGLVGHLPAVDENSEGGFDDTLGPLWELEGRLTHLSKALAQLTPPMLGFTCCGRRETMVWLPDLNAAEPEKLSAEDTAAGLLDEHVRFIRTRRLCCITLTGAISGEVELQRKEAAPEEVEHLRLPLAPGKVLIYSCDLWSHTFKATAGGSVVLKTWLLDDSLDKSKLMGDVFVDSRAAQALDVLGVLVGPPMPVGYRTHILAVHAHSSASIHSSDQLDTVHLGGGDGFVRIGLERFDIDLYYSDYEDKVQGKSYVCHAGLMDTQDMVMFDNDFFHTTTEEAYLVPPNQRQILVGGYATLHKAGFTKKSLAGQNIGVYVGDTGADFDPRDVSNSPLLGETNTGPLVLSALSKFVTAGRLSHVFGLVGSTTNVDTACSSSLVALGLAVQSWRKPGEDERRAIADKKHDAALCMASNIFTSPLPFMALCGATMLAKLGRCFTFDTSAEGYARGEGVAGMYFRPSDSEEDDSRQVACLVGCRTNQDGRSASLTAPSGVAQQQCIRGSLQEAGMPPSQVTICECHGTGTALGDPIEVGAIQEVFRRRGSGLLMSSTKSNLGHIESNAGLVGLLKCCGMATASVGFANVHLRELNAHLVMDGFPGVVQGEHVDTRLNSNLAGVSSFGFGGTNARADIWALCKKEPRSAVLREPDLEPLEVHVQCPISLGLIHHVTGEPARRSKRPGERGAPQIAVLRDVGAPYDIAPQAYEGGYRYRDEPPLHDQVDELKASMGVYICGPWSSRRPMERMQPEGRGYYSAVVRLGEARYEVFSLCLNRDSELGIYPATHNANHWIWIEGPDARGEGRRWIIDGRDEEIPAGTPYRVFFRWHPDVKTMHWDRLPDGFSLAAAGLKGLSAEPTYAVAGTFSTWHLNEMRRAGGCEGEQGEAWEAYFRIGNSGQEVFAIFRHGDRTQAIYPAKPQASKSEVPVRGPDNLRGDKSWLVRGSSGDIMAVRLTIADACISVKVASEMRGARIYRSIEGLARHEYSVIGSWTGWLPIAMDMDPEAPGVFRSAGYISGHLASETEQVFAEAFRVVVDEDSDVGWRPQTAGLPSGASIVQGPAQLDKDVHFEVRSPLLGASFQITLDLTTLDKRKVVTWELLPEEYAATNGALDFPDHSAWSGERSGSALEE